MTDASRQDPRTLWLTQQGDPRTLQATDIHHAARSLQRRGRRDFIMCTLAAVLAIARGAWAVAQDSGFRMVAGIVLVVTAVGYVYWMSKTYAVSGGAWDRAVPADVGMLPSLGFYRQELMRQKQSLLALGWLSGRQFVLVAAVVVFGGALAEVLMRYEDQIARALTAAPAIRAFGPVLALGALWAVAYVLYVKVVDNRQRELQRELEAVDALLKNGRAADNGPKEAQ